MLNSLRRAAFGTALLAGLSACASGINPSVEAMNQTAVDRAQSYAFLSEEAFMTRSPLFPGFQIEEAEAEIRGAIDVEMVEAGYVRAANSADADLLVGYMISLNEVEEQYVDVITGRFGGVRAIYVTDNDHIEGSLVIDLFDEDTGERVWSGWAKKDFIGPPRARRGEIISEAVDAILGQLTDIETS